MMKKKRNTNKNLIEEIFPVVKEAVNRWQKGKIKLDSKDYYERKQHLEWVGDFIRLVWAEYKGSEIIISAARELEHGRYDHATVTARLNKGKWYMATRRNLEAWATVFTQLSTIQDR